MNLENIFFFIAGVIILFLGLWLIWKWVLDKWIKALDDKEKELDKKDIDNAHV